ncbi:RICIN domain-containing protein [Streptacidiphilus sp. 4-A2]|nr:RICIN domain-containing protein [Streptacidiphilus sp. 4-A2]
MAGGGRPQLLHHLRPGHGRRLSQRRVRLHLADQRHHLRRQHERRLCRGLRDQRLRRRGGGTGGGTATGQITGYGGLCVDDRSASTADYNPVQVYTCNGTAAQQWTVVQAGSTIQALGKCLDIDAGGTADGTTVDLYDCNNTAAQVWEPQSDGALYNPQSNKCLDDTGWSTTPGTQLEIWDCTGNANQAWNLP